MQTKQLVTATPGPWTFEGQGGYERKRSDGSPLRSLNVGTEAGEVVAEVRVPMGGSWADPVAIANRNLIAAAPDMFAALRSIVWQYPTNSEASEIARAAIAKAEGIA